MSIVNLSFGFQLNVSIQATDQIYATLIDNNQSGRNHITGVNTKPFPYGDVVSVDYNTNIVTVNSYYNEIIGETDNNYNGNILDYYLFFAKDDRANSSGILGYYAQVEYRNYSTLPAEMFATATNFSESSK
tara:strand:- start:2285 stop:2677 length:393 start_codon:yes stop_codon:yes gene_type:complete